MRGEGRSSFNENCCGQGWPAQPPDRLHSVAETAATDRESQNLYLREIQISVNACIEGAVTFGFKATSLDDDPALLEQSYRLRYQTYCVERGFLPAEDYPDHLERDAFDRAAIHVGAVDTNGVLAATARVVMPNCAGLPLFHHCTLFPDVMVFEEAGNIVAEVSRVLVNRNYARRREDAALIGAAGADTTPLSPVAVVRERRMHAAEPFLTLLRAVYHAVKRAGVTHVIGATDKPLHRWLVHYGLPYRLAGPEVDYYGFVAPYIMSLAEFDQVILGRHFDALDGFPVGLEPALWPRPSMNTPHADTPTALDPVGRLVDP